MRAAIVLLLMLCLPAAAHAQGAATAAPADRSEPTPAEAEDVPQAESVPLPRTRPAPEPASEPEPALAPVDETPEAAEPRIYQSACPALLQGLIEATPLPPIEEEGCGERSPLEVTAVLVNGRMVPLSNPATLSCGMAAVLPEWAAAIDGYAAARENSRLARLLVGTSYMCRPRNGVAGSDISEHGFANALDVVGFELEDGRRMSLPEGWADGEAAAGRLLRFAHGAACARFTTTLGPEANALHEDHLHLDLGCHGQSCTARICE